MTNKQREEAFALVERICDDLKRWVNHSKSGFRRSEESLIEYDLLWELIDINVTDFESKREKTEFEADFLEMVKYKGNLFRIHQNYNERMPYYGIEETVHYVGWTKADKVTEIYWFYESSRGIIIQGRTAECEYGIDLNGLSDFVIKYFYPQFRLGTPTVMGEKEVVYPIKYENIKKVKLNSRIDDNDG
ncbi:hypothetical protein KQ51_01551 [Candidatus Izimaplasma bacterium HR1]|nr:hypothetical protein KQ51_01551 [Candidatus Izimaplasma bacterium HR1]